MLCAMVMFCLDTLITMVDDILMVSLCTVLCTHYNTYRFHKIQRNKTQCNYIRQVAEARKKCHPLEDTAPLRFFFCSKCWCLWRMPSSHLTPSPHLAQLTSGLPQNFLDLWHIYQPLARDPGCLKGSPR